MEPLPWAYERLLHNWEGFEQLVFARTAIQPYEGTCDLWALPPEESGREGWDLSVLATTKRELFGHPTCLSGNDALTLMPRVVPYTVPCTTLDALLRKHDIATLDLLQIDAQGGDFDVIRSLDIERIQPRWINFEHTLLGASTEECMAYLSHKGYNLSPGLDETNDLLATRLNETSR